MRVKCKFNKVDEIPDMETRNRLSQSIHREGPDEDLAIGNIYSVLALARWNDGGTRVYLHTVEESEYPYPYPLEMFEVTDPSLPTGWVVSFEKRQGTLVPKLISFVEWDRDGQFYEKLLEGDEQAIAAYRLQRSNLEQR